MQDDIYCEITLIDLFKLFTSYKWLASIIVLSCMLTATIIAYILPPVYKTEVLLSPIKQESNNSNGLSKIAGQVGNLVGIGSLAGPETSNVGIAIAIVNSRAFTNSFIMENNLMPLLFKDSWDSSKKEWIADDPSDIPTLWHAYKKFHKEIRSINQDKTSGFINLVVNWNDPKVAQKWATLIVQKVNETMRKDALRKSSANIKYLQNQLNLTKINEIRDAIVAIISSEMKTQMLAHASNEYVFHTIDPAYFALEPDKPKKILVIALGLIVGILLSIICIFILSSRNRRNKARSSQ